MKRFSIFCIVFFLTACGSSEKKFDSQSYEHYKESLAEKEKKNPLAFLTVTAENKKKYYRANCSAWKNIKQGNC
jgi:major membrane immunogen (membrane-anchored lipoprotein)